MKSYLAVGVGLLVAACGGTGPGDSPTISTVTPATGTVGTELRIVGTDFQTGAEVLVGDFTATGVAVNGATEIFASVPAGVVADSTYDVTVRNTSGGEITFADAFTAVVPVLSFVNGATRPSGSNGSTVIVEGHAFGDAQGSGQVLFSNGAGGTVVGAIAAADDWTDSFIITTVPAAAADGPILVQTGTGTSNSLDFVITNSAPFSPSAIAWNAGQSIPTAVSGHSATYVPIVDGVGTTVEHIYVIGGAKTDSIPLVDVDYTIIQTDGSISGFSTGTALPAGRAFHRTVSATQFNSKVQRPAGFLFVLGGIETKNGDPVTTVYQVPLNSDGTTGAAVTSTALPAPLHSFGAVVFRSTIYIAGGATTGNVPSDVVYRSEIDTLGNLGAWEALTSLPSARAYHGFGQFGAALYVFGGETGTVDPNDGNYTSNASKTGEVLYAPINLRDGLLPASWTVNGSAMQKSRSKASALIAGSNVFVTAGLYAAAGTASTESIYATLNSNGSVSTFNGATGSNTISALGGINLFNHAAVSYIDATGNARVMVLGGDDVNNPGTKSKAVFYY